jgi:hypothetical protein
MGALTVRALINKLKKMPPTALVAVQAHDQSEWAMDGYIWGVEEGSDELHAAQRREGRTGQIVVLQC